MSMEQPTMAQLAATLATHDLPVLRVVRSTAPLSLKPPELIAALSQVPDGRLGEALIALFLRHPVYAEHVPWVVAELPAPAAQRLQHLYTAAVYLQRLWHGLLELYLGDLELLPNYFGMELWNLPAPDVHSGEAGLRDLAQRMTEETGDNWLSTYESALSLLLAYLRQEQAFAT
jgi:hypothetical protein